ncbi:MAG: cupin domain-containing protein [Candidatus Korarchaeota archaeon]|nr:cupin domain-containing protein [Candidatus Korarchaeota archaeon]NIU83643.1 cupin domain-containing protein [Candidatus Thorarchaeota archaeon]NIW13870.1 cupin domain-containing protein [Candidatus Thorarchaeota archaeon]NIW51981.1 cupin domain-containing protein [Candidatus Korarchaeota archaeon]
MVEIVRLTDQTWKKAVNTALPLVSHRNVEIGILTLSSGERLPEEGYSSHEDNEEYALILSGTVTFCTENDRYELCEGDLPYNSKGTRHYTINETNSLAKLLWILSPGRK